MSMMWANLLFAILALICMVAGAMTSLSDSSSTPPKMKTRIKGILKHGGKPVTTRAHKRVHFGPVTYHD